MDKRTRKYFINILLIVTLTFVVLYFSLKDNTDEVLEIFNSLNPLAFGVCLLAILCYHGIVGEILTMFARFYNPNYRFRSGYLNALIAALFHGITPFASGGQFMQAYVFHEDDIDVGESASILLMDFIVYQTTLVTYTLLCVIIEWKKFLSGQSSLYSLALFGFIINFVVILCIWIFARSLRMHKWLCETGVNIVYKLHLIKNKEDTINHINGYLDKFNCEVKRLATKPGLIMKVIIADIARLTLFFSIPALCAWALKVPMSFNLYVESIALASFICMINSFIPLPGASGGTEGTFILLFTGLVGRGNATCMMLVWRFVTYYFILLVGLIAYVRFKKEHKIRQIEEEIYENRSVQ